MKEDSRLCYFVLFISGPRFSLCLVKLGGPVQPYGPDGLQCMGRSDKGCYDTGNRIAAGAGGVDDFYPWPSCKVCVNPPDLCRTTEGQKAGSSRRL